MQIFEVTSKQKVDEVNIGATARAVGSNIANRALSTIGQAAGVSGQEFSNTIRGAGTPTLTGAAAQQAAAKAAQPIIQRQAQAAQTAWRTEATALARAAGVPYSQINAAQRTNALDKFVNDQLLGGRITDYKQLPNLVDPNSFGGKGVQLAKQTVANIDAAMNAILAQDPTTTPARQQLQAWQNLAQLTYSAMNQSTFQAGTGPAQQKKAPTAPAAADPRTAAMMAAMGLGADDLAKMNAAIKAKGGFKGRPTGDPYIDGMLRAAKLI